MTSDPNRFMGRQLQIRLAQHNTRTRMHKQLRMVVLEQVWSGIVYRKLMRIDAITEGIKFTMNEALNTSV